MTRVRRLLADLRHQPRRGDAVEAWLKAQRDENRDDDHGRWSAYNDLLDRYRLHADTGTPLDRHVCEDYMTGDCDEQPTTAPF